MRIEGQDGPEAVERVRPAASQRDVADAAGVSVSTVSRALSNADGISDDLRRRIVKLAAELGYDRRGPLAPVTQAALMVVNLDLFSGDAAGFYREIIEAIEAEFERHGVELETLFIEDPATGAEEIVARSEIHGGAGALLVGVDHPDLLTTALRSCRAALIVNGIDPEMQLDGVAPANRLGAQLATRHLIELGHRRILHVTALRRQTIRDRLEGYRSALEVHGIEHEPALVVDLPQLHPDAASAAIRAHLAEHGGKLDATAVFAASDMVAVGVIRALTEAGIGVPEQCSVVGFDNTRVTARARPGLTTIDIDTAEIGRRSVRRLLERLRNPELTPMSVQIGCSLVERESARALKTGGEHA